MALLHSPVVLYLVGLIAVGNLMMFVYARQFMCIGVFIVSLLLTSFYTKNMIAALVVAMVACNIVCASFGHTNERFKGKMGKLFKKAKKAAKAQLLKSKAGSDAEHPFFVKQI